MKRLLFAVLFAAIIYNASAYDFSAVSPSGHMLYYNIIQGKAILTHPNSRPYEHAYDGYAMPVGAVIIPDSVIYNGSAYAVTTIDVSAFYQCGGITSVSIPNTVTRIEERAFNSCGLRSLVIPNSVSYMGNCTFLDCDSLITLTIGSGLAQLDYNTFHSCENLSTVYFNATNCTYAGTSSLSAFRDSYSLTTVYIGENVTRLPSYLFIGSPNLTNLVVYATTPPSLGTDVFSANSMTITVPCQSIVTYRNSWGNAYNIQCTQLNFSLTINTNDSTWGTANYSALGDSVAKIVATANNGYHFDHWSYGSTSNPDTLLLSNNVTITAIFAKNRYLVTGTTNDSAMGTVTGSATVDYLDSITLTASSNHGYHFDHWNDGETSNPRYVVATSNTNLVAFFQKNRYAVVSTVGDTLQGTVVAFANESVTDYSNLYLNDFVQMTSDSVAPAGDNYFRHVLTRSITNGTDWFCYYTFESADGAMTWYFTPRCTGRSALGFQSLRSNNNNLFTDTTIGNTTVYNDLQGVSITYSNLGWVIEFPVDVHCTHKQTNAAHASVYWKQLNYRNNDTLYAKYLDEISIEATQTYGYHFVAWNDGDTNNPRTITLTQDTAFIALFANNQYTLMAMSSDTIIGSVSGGGIYNYLDTAVLTATAAEHYHFIRWSDGSTMNPRRMVITRNLSITATFGIDTHAVNLQVANITHGSIIGNGNYEYGTAVTVEAIPYSGYQFSHWNDSSTYNPYTFAVVRDVQLTAYFYAIGTPYQDTIVIYDTLYVNVPVHDTTYINVPVHDTTYINVPVHDTSYINIHDTTYITQRDTVINTVTVHDTLTNYIHDTLWLHDTIVIHDTVYITQDGIGNVGALNAKVYSSRGQIVIEGADGNTVTLYDVNGRILAIKHDDHTSLRFDVPASGTYMIKIGNHVARKVVVIR